ncbi:hypothetical protein CE557_442 [Cardinium endosymbiont of Sogatella furcifera]|uniref:hypothetical protein n=1 Tax=Cardinium endosymbiont of Sogatella furcifera TaxID=650378 RepID=UPI000E10852C|nr:hypothetical protein [Cardinium endosymbiont of Sogatella furcifera]AXI24261.1 hypothetical protein CE557_442 [Cardinium endosymbiont of Sogatella furcifera]
MQYKIKQLVWFFLMGLMVWMKVHAAPSSTLKKLKKGIYEENLVVYRIEFCKQPKAVKKAPPMPLVCLLDQSDHLAQRLAQRKAAYLDRHSLKGYTIQLYMGGSRTAALKAQELGRTFSYPAKLHYRQPHYTVQLGFFLDRLEAYLVYLNVVSKITHAMIRPCMRTREAYLADNVGPPTTEASKEIVGDALPVK